ncbi:hypothetical protein HRR83_008162 [Exophiala dermatitidis]|uniref:Actin-like ATPase domain-containing protein n=2 Tax=Exophiala dermatitidis TaxID=5970 RepID=H6BSV7_EXODN|nr:uncharacterized protein HMPREF1120_02432 [Exophiala dermatitidis NIH/UT8656]KAJ4507999.1 hypothetical protein HRR74_007884 [Exophiala dermatitidis]EHY54261.1 hypothetical protein HMPREF1120_02432 [Exophiala dermatitidis NIH/UT8656]KAJ4513592.1 hypothetical protein HRR73_005750 [Exophiala dermatitidis]KAJ4535565.1 hypothetical protein HRR77_007884 [Exophiala dermatitidis]KAJ4544489.1 hypothetical protein HRR76_002548 [Exophiala dermatitidis]
MARVLEDVLGLLDAELPREGSRSFKSTGSGQKSTARKRGPTDTTTGPAAQAKRQKNDSKPATKTSKKNIMVVGIDAGCTYSAIATGIYGQPASQVKVYQAWHKNQNKCKDKVPSRIAYAEENDFPEDKFGNDIKPDNKSTVWWKLRWGDAIHVSQNNLRLLEHSVGAEVMRLPEGKDHTTVTTDWLHFLYQKIMMHYHDFLGMEAFDETTFHFCLAVPANWTPEVRGLFLQCAASAGIGGPRGGVKDEVIFVSEPEASTVAALQASLENNGGYAVKNSCIMLVDLGGGTMDGTVHVVKKTRPLKLEEACPQLALQCGGTDIDRAFHSHLKQIFGEAFINLPSASVCAGSAFMDAFEDIKCEFTGTDDDERVSLIPLRIPDLDEEDPAMQKAYDFRRNSVRITREQVKEMFEVAVEKACLLVAKLHESIPPGEDKPELQTCILSGGLGSSPYMRSRIDEHVQKYFGGKVELVQPERPWPAVALGAAMIGCERGQIVARKSQYFIGIVTHEQFDAEKHHEDDKFKCPLLGLRAKNQMQWHLKRNDEICPKMTKTIKTYAAIGRSRSDRSRVIISQRLYGYQEDDPPSRLNDSVRCVGTIRMDVTKIVETKQREMRSSGRRTPLTIEIPINIDVIVGSERGVLEVQAKCGRQKLDGTTIHYEKDLE